MLAGDNANFDLSRIRNLTYFRNRFAYLEQLRKSTATARIAIRFEPVGKSLAVRIVSQVLGKNHQSFHFAVDPSGCNFFLQLSECSLAPECFPDRRIKEQQQPISQCVMLFQARNP
jgi:hypothetical protein